MLGTALATSDRAARHQRPRRSRHGRAGPRAQPVLLLDAAVPGDGRHRLELERRVHPDRHPDVRHAGRDAAALRHCRARLQCHRQMAVLAAGRADARQHRHVRHVRGHLRLERRDGGHRRRGGAAADQDPRLRREPVSRHAGGRRHARHPDPAVDQLHPLRSDHLHLRAAPLSRRHDPGPAADQLLHDDRARLLHRHRQARAARSWRPAGAIAFASLKDLSGAAVHLLRRRRLDLPGLGDADGSRLAWASSRR